LWLLVYIAPPNNFLVTYLLTYLLTHKVDWHIKNFHIWHAFLVLAQGFLVQEALFGTRKHKKFDALSSCRNFLSAYIDFSDFLKVFSFYFFTLSIAFNISYACHITLLLSLRAVVSAISAFLTLGTHCSYISHFNTCLLYCLCFLINWRWCIRGVSTYNNLIRQSITVDEHTPSRLDCGVVTERLHAAESWVHRSAEETASLSLLREDVSPSELSYTGLTRTSKQHSTWLTTMMTSKWPSTQLWQLKWPWHVLQICYDR